MMTQYSKTRNKLPFGVKVGMGVGAALGAIYPMVRALTTYTGDGAERAGSVIGTAMHAAPWCFIGAVVGGLAALGIMKLKKSS